jgi:hypothetical protein
MTDCDFPGKKHGFGGFEGMIEHFMGLKIGMGGMSVYLVKSYANITCESRHF